MNHDCAILLVNLGSPEKPEPFYVKKYLRQFLSDPRIIETPHFYQKCAWQLLLNGIILNVRSKKSAQKYRSIWFENESPLLFYTRQITEKLQEKSNIYIDFAMRYGAPSIGQKLCQLQQKGFHKIVVVPLFAQYSATTIGSIMDEVARYVLSVRHQPKIRALYGWFDNEHYIQALMQTMQTHALPRDILVSFHGIPQQYSDAGDPYFKQCQKTFELLQNQLPEHHLHFGFQSRFGPAKWLEPYTFDLLEQLPQNHIENLAVLCPGFSTDCLETLEEIAMMGKKIFLENGGKNFVYLPALNAQNCWIESLWKMIQQELNNF